jgi:hypothetical protein
VIREEHGRLIVHCDRCPARLDLGSAYAARARNRTPSGWIKTASDTHHCPLCSPSSTAAAVFASVVGHRPQPLL